MIKIVMLVALGFTAASLLALLIAPRVWRRAVRLTTRKLEATLPISLADINADKDLLRAESAVEIRRLELALEQARERAARHLMERNIHTVEIGKLKSEIAALKNTVVNRTQAGSVMEQTVRRRIPRLEAKLKEAGQVIAASEKELAERARAYDNQNESVELAQQMIRRQEREIDRLRETLESGLSRPGRFWSKTGNDDAVRAALAKKNGELEVELSRLREELARLMEIEASDAAELRAEMHRLAGLMLGGAPRTAPKKSVAKPETGSKKGKEAGIGDAKKQAGEEKKPSAKTPSGSKTGAAKPRKSLSERLARVRGRKEKEDA